MTETPTTPEADDDELREIAKRGRDSYSLATDNGWSQRESDLAAYQAVFAAGRTQALEEAATLIEAQESPFHFVPDTETFWRAKAILARSIRTAATQTGEKS